MCVQKILLKVCQRTAEKELGWNREYDLKDLVNDMMESDLKGIKKELYLKKGGYRIKSDFE